jgi:hypothetical protein
VVIAPVVASPIPVAQDAKAELEKKKAEVDENDAGALFELALWADGQGLRTDSKRLLRKVIKVDKNHKEARQLLGYVWFDDRWVTKREKERLERKKEEEEKLAQGLRKWRGEWVPVEDYEMYEKGLVPMEVEGQRKWVTPEDKERIEKGMFLHDSGQWITKEEKAQIDQGMILKTVDGERKVVSREEADELSATFDNRYKLEREYIKLESTCHYDFLQNAMVHADKSVQQVYSLLDLSMPEDFVKVDLILVKDADDYRRLGEGVQDNNDAVMSSTYSAFTHQDPGSGRFLGITQFGGLAEGDPGANENYARIMLRHAAADATLRNIGYNEQVPRWFQIGIGAYCSRYWDPLNSTGISLLGQWSMSNLQREGGTLKLKSFFDSFSVSTQTILQCGLIVSFLNHGSIVPKKVAEQWDKVKEAMKASDEAAVAKEFVRLEIALATKDAEKAFENYSDQLMKG